MFIISQFFWWSVFKRIKINKEKYKMCSIRRKGALVCWLAFANLPHKLVLYERRIPVLRNCFHKVLQVLAASFSAYVLQDMVKIFYPLPWTLQLSSWAVLLPETPPYIIQICWLLTPFVTLASWVLYLISSSHMAQLSQVISTLGSSRCPCLYLCSLFYLK